MRIESNVILKGLLRLLNLNEVTAYSGILVVDATGQVRKAASLNPVNYQLSGIVSTTYGLINLVDLIGTATGSYHVKIELQFGDLNHTGYKLSAHRIIEFSFVSYQSGTNILHTEPVLMLQQHSGLIVRLSDNVVFDLLAQDIDFSTQLVSNMLRINVRNNLNTSSIPAANASIKCRYTVQIKKFTFDTVPEESSE